MMDRKVALSVAVGTALALVCQPVKRILWAIPDHVARVFWRKEKFGGLYRPSS